MKIPVVEIMSSIQGEGLVVGRRQVFIRFSGCNICCRYCDTKHQLSDTEPCIVEKTPGHRDFVAYPNPLSPKAINDIISDYPLTHHHSISLTGGEPLLHVGFLQQLIPLINQHGPLIYLETNGTLPDSLEKIIHLVDIVSMDVKLPSVTGIAPLWGEHLRFLQIAQQKEAYVKVVIGELTTLEEIRQLCDVMAEIIEPVPLVLQPVTPTRGVIAPAPQHILELQDQALKFLKDVRVIPQTHRMIGQL